MKTNIIKNSAKGIGLSLLMAVGLVAFTGTEANAQYRDQDDRQERRDDRQDRRDDRQERRDDRRDDRYDRNRNDLYRVARENGFRDGRVEAREDQRDRDRDNPQRAAEYRKATNGYYARLGNKNTYREAYRQAFLEGYNAVINRNNRGNRNRNGY